MNQRVDVRLHLYVLSFSIYKSGEKGRITVYRGGDNKADGAVEVFNLKTRQLKIPKGSQSESPERFLSLKPRQRRRRGAGRALHSLRRLEPRDGVQSGPALGGLTNKFEELA